MLVVTCIETHIEQVGDGIVADTRCREAFVDEQCDLFVDECRGLQLPKAAVVLELMLEITESAYTEDSDQIISVVKALREKGFFIEMDDFGTGYSSLNMISTLPIDALKLDMQFIKNAFRQSRFASLFWERFFTSRAYLSFVMPSPSADIIIRQFTKYSTNISICFL